MIKKFVLLFLLFTILGCQREKISEIEIGYNETLIVPPTNNLPLPGEEIHEPKKNNNGNRLVESILIETKSYQSNETVIDIIDQESGYKTDENFFQWLFKGKSKR